MSNFTFFHNVFYAICTLKSSSSHTSVIICSFFELGTVSKWCIREWVNPLPHKKILDSSKLKAFADDKIRVTEKLKFVLERVENTVGKGENAGHQHFLLFPQGFQKASFSGALKVGIEW